MLALLDVDAASLAVIGKLVATDGSHGEIRGIRMTYEESADAGGGTDGVAGIERCSQSFGNVKTVEDDGLQRVVGTCGIAECRTYDVAGAIDALLNPFDTGFGKTGTKGVTHQLLIGMMVLAAGLLGVLSNNAEHS